jgi:DNA-binding CsgD family transcriptional regulator
MLLQITPVERAALQLLAEGKNHVEIAARLETSTGELEATLSVLFSRMGVRTPADAISAGLKRGLLTVDGDVAFELADILRQRVFVNPSIRAVARHVTIGLTQCRS